MPAPGTPFMQSDQEPEGNNDKFTLLRRIPSLISLRAFESVARHGSCTRAAEELNVTAAAVSQQIRLLENYAGQVLFKRQNRKFVLTDAGRACLPELRKSFDHLLNAMNLAEGQRLRRSFRLSVPPSFAVRWLIPHFHELTADTDRCDFWVSTSLVPFHLDDTNIDLAVIHGSGRFFGQGSELLVPTFEVPVCHPRLLAAQPVARPEDLRHHHLIHEVAEVNDSAVPSWADWFAARNVAGVDVKSGSRFSNPNLVVEAALAGLGVALARGALVKRELASGALVCPLGPPAADDAAGDAGYYLVRNPHCGLPDVAEQLCLNFKRVVARYEEAPRARS